MKNYNLLKAITINHFIGLCTPGKECESQIGIQTALNNNGATAAEFYTELHDLRDSLKIRGFRDYFKDLYTESIPTSGSSDITDAMHVGDILGVEDFTGFASVIIDESEWTIECQMALVSYLRELKGYPIDLNSTVYDFFIYLNKFDESIKLSTI